MKASKNASRIYKERVIQITISEKQAEHVKKAAELSKMSVTDYVFHTLMNASLFKFKADYFLDVAANAYTKTSKEWQELTKEEQIGNLAQIRNVMNKKFMLEYGKFLKTKGNPPYYISSEEKIDE